MSFVPGLGTVERPSREEHMKGQDLGLMLKLICLQKKDDWVQQHRGIAATSDWEKIWEIEMGVREGGPGWGNDLPESELIDQWIVERYSVRNLAKETGISKSQVSVSLNAMIDIGLVKYDRKLHVPRTNKRALFEFLIAGVRYVFPAKKGELTRGIATSFAAPVLEGKLMSGGEMVPVWAEPSGNTKGLAVNPLFKSFAVAIRNDPEMYRLLALIDALRIGLARERELATSLLKKQMEISDA